MLGEEKEDHLLGDTDHVYKDEAVQEHGKLVLGEQEALRPPEDCGGRKDGAGETGLGCQAVLGVIPLLSLPERDPGQVVFLT